jgi:hypothetical protein
MIHRVASRLRRIAGEIVGNVLPTATSGDAEARHAMRMLTALAGR